MKTEQIRISLGISIMLCCFVTTPSETAVKENNVIDNSSESFDELNVTELTKDLWNLTNTLKGIRDLILRTEDTEELNGLNEDVISVKETNKAIEEVISEASESKEAKSYELYFQAKFMMKSPLERNKKEGYELLLKASDEGCSDAKSEIAWAYLFGKHVKQSIPEALRMFRELADSGHPEGHTGMALLHAVGVGVQRSEDRALLHFTLAALGGSLWAKMALGHRYRYGVSVRADCEQALLYYRQVAEKVVVDFKPHEGLKNNLICILDEEDKSNLDKISRVMDAKYFYEMMADMGDIPSQFNYAKLLYHGSVGLERDVEKSLKYFKLAESNKNHEASAFIGKIYYEGSESIEVNFEKAFEYFEKAAFYENPVGEAGLGLMYLEGKFVKQNTYKAFRYLNKSAHKGWVDGLIYLARMHFDGIGIVRDYSLARRYLLTASQSGHTLALYYLGKMNENGLGSFRSCMTAVEFYKGVAEKGSWDNLFVEAYIKFSNQEYDESFMMFALLAEMGYATGQLNCAMILDDFPVQVSFVGDGEQSFHKSRKALDYWTMAARQGETRALIKMGDHFYYGLGTEVDYDTAAAIYQYAASAHGNAEAFFNLGFMHEHGIGLRQDLNLAKRYYDLSLESSQDGWLPVKLALLKLSMVQLIQYLLGAVNDSRSSLLIKKVASLSIQYWDIVLISVLSIFCRYLIIHGFR